MVDRPAHQAKRRLIIKFKKNADGDEGEHHRGQHQHQQDAAHGKDPGEHQGEQETDDQLQDNRGTDDDGCGLKTLPDFIVGQHLFVIIEAAELRDGELVGTVVEEAEPEGPKQREDVHHEQHDDRRRDQKRTTPFRRHQPGPKAALSWFA